MSQSDPFDIPVTSSTLLVTVASPEETYRQSRDAVERLARGEDVEEPDRFNVSSVDRLFETFNPRTMELLRTIDDQNPGSIRETARLVGRDKKNVHDELTRLHRLGVIRLYEDGQAKRPVVPYEEIVISLPLGRDEATDATRASP